MSIPRPLFRGNQQGLTLIEILVAMTISLVLLAGVVQILAGSKASYRINEAHSRLQENGRFALQMMAEDIRMAGFWGCLGNTTEVIDRLNPGGNVNPVLGGISGIEGGVGVPPPVDSIAFQGAVGGGLPVNAYDEGAASITTTINNGLAQDDLFLVGDCEKIHLLQITDVDPATGTVTFLAGAGVPGNATGLGDYDPLNAVLHRAASVAYAINNGNSGQPSLFRSVNGNPMELVEGVENLQILYGEDLDADGTTNSYNAADGVNMANVVSVRIILTLRSLNDNLASIEDPVTFDRRLRRTFSSTIVLRNRIPLSNRL